MRRLVEFAMGGLWTLAIAAFGSCGAALWVGDLHGAVYFALAMMGSIATLSLLTLYRLRHG